MTRAIRYLIRAAAFMAPGLSIAAPPPGAAACMGCHPATASANPAESPVPSLSSRSAAEIITAMQDYRAGTRPATVMDRLAKGFTDEETRAIAQWYERSAKLKQP